MYQHSWFITVSLCILFSVVDSIIKHRLIVNTPALIHPFNIHYSRTTRFSCYDRKTQLLAATVNRVGSSMTVSSLSNQMKEMRSTAMLDERSSLMLDALRGKNINDDDKQGLGVDMKLVEVRGRDSNDVDDVLPTTYDTIELDKYFNKRPLDQVTRVWQVLSASASYISGVLLDYATGNTANIEVRRAAELRNTIVSLGPFFIKIGQALSIRPDILSTRAMVELQQLCDKVPCFDSNLAMATIESELGRPPDEMFSEITAEPVAAASLGQVYRARLRATGEEVAVKVQRPFVLETVSLDLYLVRKMGLFLRNFPSISSRLDIVGLLDEFAANFYQELDYNLECLNGIRIAEDMKKLPNVLIPKNYPEYTSRRVHVAQWINGEKLSQSKANDVSSLVNLGVITYLTQLLDTGFFHADPHPGNMLRTDDGRLVILDFGLMTKITDDQKYGMIEAIAHLIHRDYSEIGNDFVNLDFIPRGVDTAPIVPALARVFEAALAGGGAKSINFQELAADLAEITFKFPFRIPPYFALIIRAISVLEGIALVGNPEFAIVDEAYPFISKRLMTDESPRLRAAFRYMVYGKGDTMDVDRMIDMLQALEKFVAVKDFNDGSAFKVDGVRGDVYVGKGGDAVGTKRVDGASSIQREAAELPPLPSQGRSTDTAREALKFFFSDEGALFREFLLDEVSTGVDALGRDAARELLVSLGVRGSSLPPLLRALAPRLTPSDRRVVDGMLRLLSFLGGGGDGSSPTGEDGDGPDFSRRSGLLLSAVRRPENRAKAAALLPALREFAPNIRLFGRQLAQKLALKATARAVRATSDAIFGRGQGDTAVSASKSRTVNLGVSTFS